MNFRKSNFFFFKLNNNCNLFRNFKSQFIYLYQLYIYCFKFIYYFIYINLNNIYFFKNINSMYKLFLIKKIKPFIQYLIILKKKNFFFLKCFLYGLGYKIFIYKSKIYILFGLSHYILLNIPSNIFFNCKYKKKKIFFLSTNNIFLQTLKLKLIIIQKLNLYKLKGLFFFKENFIKNNIYFKKGKKQQFM